MSSPEERRARSWQVRVARHGEVGGPGVRGVSAGRVVSFYVQCFSAKVHQVRAMQYLVCRCSQNLVRTAELSRKSLKQRSENKFGGLDRLQKLKMSVPAKSI